MAIAVIGMHRSGTSMVTGMLAHAGLQVGPSHELLGPSHENPTGYWERRPMVLLDDAVLDLLGLAWDHVPALPGPGWEQDARFDTALIEAQGLVASFPSDRPWGWKDPRTSITLPLWERALGGPATCVVCVRNPLDVAASLATRGGTSPRLAFQLWTAYTQRAMDLARARTHVVTHYDAYFEDAAAELVRVCAAIGLEPTEQQLATATGSANSAHRHASSGLAQLVDSSAPDETVALYLEALAEAGPVMGAVAMRDELGVESDGEPLDREETITWVREFRRSRRGVAVR